MKQWFFEIYCVNIFSSYILSIMSTSQEYTYIKWTLQLIKCFNFTSTFNLQQKLIIVFCHKVKLVFMETFLYSGYLLLWLLCRSYSVLSCSSQSTLDIRAWFIERGNVDIITLLIVFHYCLYVSCKMSHAIIMMNPSLASNFKTNLKQLQKKTVGICFKQKPLLYNCNLFLGF